MNDVRTAPRTSTSLCRYEDMDEFEDAMDSSFDDFIARFPIVEVKPDERVTGGHVFRVCSCLSLRPVCYCSNALCYSCLLQLQCLAVPLCTRIHPSPCPSPIL